MGEIYRVKNAIVEGQDLGVATCVLEPSGAVKINLGSNDVPGINRIDIVTHISKVRMNNASG